MSPREKMISLLADHQTEGFYVGRNIPERKLENAIAHFPIAPTTDIFALIDCTVMGSCKCGMAITDCGLIWKNDWASASRSPETSLAWDDLLDRKQDIKIEKHGIVLGKGARLGMAGASMKKLEAYHLIIALIDFLGEMKGEMQHQIYDAQSAQSERAQLEYGYSNKTNALQTPDGSPNAQRDLFEKSLITALALMTVADGNIDEDEVDIVIEFIKEEESIADKAEALSEFESQMERFSSSLSKSQAIFKLQAAKAIAEIGRLTDKELIDRLEIMLEGMVDVAGGANNTRTVDMMRRIMDSVVGSSDSR